MHGDSKELAVAVCCGVERNGSEGENRDVCEGKDVRQFGTSTSE